MSILRGVWSRRRLIGATAAAFFLYFAFHLWTEFQHESLLGSDGYYHIKIAALYGTGECAITGDDFPWTQFSSYHRLRHDWHLGYHLALIPFTTLDLVFGAKLSTAVFAAFLFATVYLVLRWNRVPWPWFFWLVAIFSSSSTLWRYHLPRPTTLVVPFFLLLVHFMARKESVLAGVTLLITLLVYNIPHSFAAACVAALVVLTVHDRRFPTRLAACLAVGLAAGLLLHPGSWNWKGDFLDGDWANLQLWNLVQGCMETSVADNLIEIGDETVFMHLGGEYTEPQGRAIRSRFGLPLVAFVGSFLLLGLRPRRLSPVALLYLCLGSVFFMLFLDHLRFQEYWVPLLVLGCATAIGPVVDELPILGGSPDAIEERATTVPSGWRRLCEIVAFVLMGGQLLACLVFPGQLGRAAFWIPTAVAGLALLTASALIRLPIGLALGGAVPRASLWLGAAVTTVVLVVVAKLAADSATRLDRQLAVNRKNDVFGPAMEWLKENSEPGDLVFHTRWDSFGPMFFHNHANHYLVGFDPYFLYQFDERKYLAWKKVQENLLSPRKTWETVRSFGARYLMTRNEERFTALQDQLRRSSGFRVAYWDKVLTLYEVEERW
jgi:hypothetical protein